MQLNSIAVSALAQTVALTAGHTRPAVFRKKERSWFQRDSNIISAKGFVPAAQKETTPHDLAARRNTIGSVNKANESATTKQPPNEPSRDECNPRTKKIDLGIFSCGANRQCVEDKGSSLGGFCTNYKKIEAALHRSLEDEGNNYFCHGDNEGKYGVETTGGLTCDCTKFANGVGTITCVSSGCFEPPADYVCYTGQHDIEIGVNSSYTFQFCQFRSENTTTSFPIESMCFGYTITDGMMPTECFVEVNNVTCSSCIMHECDAEIDHFGPVVDCTNTVVNTMVDECTTAADPFILDMFNVFVEGLLLSTETTAPANSAGPNERPTIAPGETPAPSSASSSLKAKAVISASFAAATWLVSTVFC